MLGSCAGQSTFAADILRIHLVVCWFIRYRWAFVVLSYLRSGLRIVAVHIPWCDLLQELCHLPVQVSCGTFFLCCLLAAFYGLQLSLAPGYTRLHTLLLLSCWVTGHV